MELLGWFQEKGAGLLEEHDLGAEKARRAIQKMELRALCRPRPSATDRKGLPMPGRLLSWYPRARKSELIPISWYSAWIYALFFGPRNLQHRFRWNYSGAS